MRLQCNWWLQCDRDLIPCSISLIARARLLVECIAKRLAIALSHLIIQVVLVYRFFCCQRLLKLALELGVASVIDIIIRIFLDHVLLWLFEHIWSEAR